MSGCGIKRCWEKTFNNDTEHDENDDILQVSKQPRACHLSEGLPSSQIASTASSTSSSTEILLPKHLSQPDRDHGSWRSTSFCDSDNKKHCQSHLNDKSVYKDDIEEDNSEQCQSHHSDKSVESTEEDNEPAEHYQSHLNDKSVPKDGIEETYPPTDDMSLHAFIVSAQQDRALHLLQRDNALSQDVLNDALIPACRNGYKYLVQKLVRFGAKVNFMDPGGNTPLMISAENRFIDIFRFLVTKKADVNAVNFAGDTALILSISSSGSTEMVKILLEQPGIHINYQNGEGNTALMKAVELLDIEVIDMLLDHSYTHGILADLKDIAVFENYLFDHSYEQSSSADFKDISSFENSLSIYTLNNHGETVIDIANRCGIGNIFNLLNQSNEDGLSPLLAAFNSRDLESFNTLLDCEFLNSHDRTYNVEEAFIQIFDTKVKTVLAQYSDIELAMIKMLLEHGADIKGTRGYSLVTDAVKAGNYQLVELLCQYGAELVSPLGKESDPLLKAAENGRCDLMELMLRYKSNRVLDSFLHSPLNSALNNCYVDCAKLLIQHGATLDIKTSINLIISGQWVNHAKFLFEHFLEECTKYFIENKENLHSIFIQAVKGGNTEIIGHILDAGADINRLNDNGVPVLVESKNGEVAQFLVQRGADVNQVINTDTNKNMTPLLMVLKIRLPNTSKNKSIDKSIATDIVKVLLQSGASVNAQEKCGKTSIMLAATKRGVDSLLKIMLDHGADLCIQDEDGNTALILAVKEKCPFNASIFLRYSKTKDFINIQNNDGDTALICAMYSGFKLIQMLIRHGADVNIKNTSGSTAIIEAVKPPQEGRVRVLKELIKAGSEINCQNNKGISPLMKAAKRQRMDCLVTLLSYGADINVVSKTDEARTAISCLINTRYTWGSTESCLEYLLDHGANANYVSFPDLIKLMLGGYSKYFPTMIRCGLLPKEIDSNKISPFLVPFKLSLLGSALLVGNETLARFFMKILFLAKSDVSSLFHNEDLRYFLVRKNHQRCLDFLNEISSKPFSLFQLAFVAVSSAVGTSPGRENRVNVLPLPQLIKDSLLFKSVEEDRYLKTLDPQTRFITYPSQMESYFDVN